MAPQLHIRKNMMPKAMPATWVLTAAEIGSDVDEAEFETEADAVVTVDVIKAAGVDMRDE